jgi:hypothetical protein
LNILIDKLSTILKNRVGDIEFNTDFRTGMLFEMLMQDRNLDKQIKLIQAIKLYYPHPEQIKDFEKAYDDIIWFYTCGKSDFENKDQDKSEKESKKKKTKSPKDERIYDYEYDDGYIYSAFLQQYEIDLQEIKYLHWWKFKSMFDALNKDTKIVEIMEYRAIDLGKIKDKDEKNRYKKLKKIYQLPDMRTEAQKESDFGSSFW